MQRAYLEKLENGLKSLTENFGQLNHILNKNNEILTKLNRNQSEITITLSDIRDSMTHETHEEINPEVKKLIAAMLGVADMVEAFYDFSLQSNQPALIEQSAMMFKSMQKKYAVAGLSRIADKGSTPDITLNQVVATDETVKEGMIAETVTSGYLYNGNVIRKSEVIIGTRKEDEQHDSWN